MSGSTRTCSASTPKRPLPSECAEGTGNGVVVVDGAPDFKIGEPVFVLVAEKEPGSIYGNNYYVAGMQHGKYSLDEAGNALSKDPSKNTSYKNLKDAVAGAKE